MVYHDNVKKYPYHFCLYLKKPWVVFCSLTHGKPQAKPFTVPSKDDLFIYGLYYRMDIFFSSMRHITGPALEGDRDRGKPSIFWKFLLKWNAQGELFTIKCIVVFFRIHAPLPHLHTQFLQSSPPIWQSSARSYIVRIPDMVKHCFLV